MKTKSYDLIIIGGGIMGLMTAYYATQFSGKKILVLEKRTVGNEYAASSGYSRSIRNDYLDPYYSLLAAEATKMWQSLEKISSEPFFIRCGVLNIAKNTVTPDLSQTYAYQSSKVLQALGFANQLFKRNQLKKTFPQFDADLACLDVDAGFLYIPAILRFLKKELKDRKVVIRESTEVLRVEKQNTEINCVLNGGKLITSKNLVVTVEAWTLEFLSQVQGAKWLKLPIVPVAQKLEYFAVPPNLGKQFSASSMPVFAYLDAGIYGHPLYKDTPGLKVAYFDPNGAKLVKSVFDPQPQNLISSNRDFICECLPSLKESVVVKEENNYYDMTPDNNFVIGQLPGQKNVYIAAGFCGTGFKFAPLIGRIMAELAFRKRTVFDIVRFDPKRFGSWSDGSVIKSLPMYHNFLNPQNWHYIKTGLEALFLKKTLP